MYKVIECITTDTLEASINMYTEIGYELCTVSTCLDQYKIMRYTVVLKKVEVKEEEYHYGG